MQNCRHCWKILKLLLEDPNQFGLVTRSFYFQTRQDKIWYYNREVGSMFSFRFVDIDNILDEFIILVADIETDVGSPTNARITPSSSLHSDLPALMS